MKKLALIVGLLSMLSATAHAYTYSQPNFFGGYNYYGNNGSLGYSQPNIFGGYNYYWN